MGKVVYLLRHSDTISFNDLKLVNITNIKVNWCKS